MILKRFVAYVVRATIKSTAKYIQKSLSHISILRFKQVMIQKLRMISLTCTREKLVSCLEVRQMNLLLALCFLCMVSLYFELLLVRVKVKAPYTHVLQMLMGVGHRRASGKISMASPKE